MVLRRRRRITVIATALLVLLSAPVVENTVASNSEIKTTSVARELSPLERVVEVPEDASSDFNFIDLPPSVQKVEPVEVKPAPEEKSENVTPAIETQAVESAQPAPVAAPEPAPAAPATRYVNVALSGGQNVVDMGAGPVLFPLGGNFPTYVAEHDYAGGWDRFGTLSPGMSVTMTGLVTGTYTVGQIINVPKGANTDSFAAFGTMPTVLLQTCVPGTDRMIVVGLY